MSLSDVKSYTCNICGKSFRRKDYLKSHMLKKGIDIDKNTIITDF